MDFAGRQSYKSQRPLRCSCGPSIGSACATAFTLGSGLVFASGTAPSAGSSGACSSGEVAGAVALATVPASGLGSTRNSSGEVVPFADGDAVKGVVSSAEDKRVILRGWILGENPAKWIPRAAEGRQSEAAQTTLICFHRAWTTRYSTNVLVANSITWAAAQARKPTAALRSVSMKQVQNQQKERRKANEDHSSDERNLRNVVLIAGFGRHQVCEFVQNHAAADPQGHRR